MNFQKEKLIIVLTVLIDVIGIGIIIPILPFYVESFGVSEFVVTLLFSVFSFFAFFSAPLLGALSDKFGRRPMLLLSLLSTSIGWFVFASAHSVLFLFLGRIIDGMAAGNLPIAQGYLIDIAKDERERTNNLGIIGAAFGIGFIVGPAIGAALSHIHPVLPFWFVGGLAMANVIGAFFFLPESHLQKDHAKKIALNPVGPIIKALKDTSLKSRYTAWFLFGIAIAAIQSIFALYLKSAFRADAKFIGFVATLMGILMVINQAILLPRFWLKRFSESFLEIWLFLIYAGVFLLLSVPILPIFVAGLLLNVFFQSTLRIAISSQVAGMAGQHRRGEVLGILSSILSLAMIIGPILSGILFEISLSLPFFMSSLSLLCAFFLMKYCGKHPSMKKQIKEGEVPQAL
ncbi:MFS transporter [Candidatus Peregrinibacteria bacterium]|nr:MFS transporter [Candidatus Peregrinibacteria bacterium]